MVLGKLGKDPMVLISQKRVVVGLSLSLLLTPVIPTKAYNENTGIAIGIGLLGLIGAGIAYACGGKSDEQILDDAWRNLKDAQDIDRIFASEYMSSGDIERHVLEPAARRAYYELKISVVNHLNKVQDAIKALEQSAKEAREAVQKLREKGKTYERIYDRLIAIERDIDAELSYARAYYNRFAEHRAYFEIYALEQEICNNYQREIAYAYEYRPETYRFEEKILKMVQSYDTYTEYPLVRYYNKLNNYVHRLESALRDLRYHYMDRTPTAQNTLLYLTRIREIIGNAPEYRAEAYRKKQDDMRQEEIALQRRIAEAREREALAMAARADAEYQRAQAERERNRIEREKLNQPTVVVVERY